MTIPLRSMVLPVFAVLTLAGGAGASPVAPATQVDPPPAQASGDPAAAPAAEGGGARSLSAAPEAATDEAMVADSGPVSAGAEVLFVSAYVWRGFVPADAPSYQPAAWVAVGDLTISSWVSLSGRSAGSATEHDLTVDYSRAWRDWTLSVGWINYVFPQADTDGVSNEIYGGLAYGGPLTPSLRVYHDVHAGSGTYVSLAVGHTMALANRVELSPAVAVGYNHRAWIDRSGWSDVNVSLKAAVPLGRSRLWVVPLVGYSHPMSRAIGPRRAYGGLGLTVR